MINIFGKDKWSLKITSLLKKDSYNTYDESDYDIAPADLPWVIAKEDAKDRKTISTTFLEGSEFYELKADVSDDDSESFGDGSILGFASIIRPESEVGKFTYIGASTVIDINCKIGDFVNIGDNVTIGSDSIIGEGAIIESNVYLSPGSVVNPYTVISYD